MKLLIMLTFFMNLSFASDDAFKAGFEFYDVSSNNYKLPDSKGESYIYLARISSEEAKKYENKQFNILTPAKTFKEKVARVIKYRQTSPGGPFDVYYAIFDKEIKDAFMAWEDNSVKIEKVKDFKLKKAKNYDHNKLEKYRKQLVDTNSVFTKETISLRPVSNYDRIDGEHNYDDPVVDLSGDWLFINTQILRLIILKEKVVYQNQYYYRGFMSDEFDIFGKYLINGTEVIIFKDITDTEIEENLGSITPVDMLRIFIIKEKEKKLSEIPNKFKILDLPY